MDLFALASVIIAGFLLLIGSVIALFVLRYSCRLRKHSNDLLDHQLVKSHSCSVSPMPIVSPSSALTNNSRKPRSNRRRQAKPIRKKSLKKKKVHHHYKGILQLGAALTDRPFSIAMQPLDAMGPILMKINTSEEHWIRPEEQ